jgi:3',5'-cyclic AMP phosphodiesterase CpdA
VSTNILGSFTFAVKEIRDDLEKLYRDTLVILMFKKCLDQLDISDDLAQITWTNEFADLIRFLRRHISVKYLLI